MRQKLVVAAVSTMFLLTSFSASASFTVLGGIECPDVVKEHKEEQFREMNKWWLLGYFTGRNLEQDASVGRGQGKDKIYRWALDHCENNPSDDWEDAARETYNQMEGL